MKNTVWILIHTIMSLLSLKKERKRKREREREGGRKEGRKKERKSSN